MQRKKAVDLTPTTSTAKSIKSTKSQDQQEKKNYLRPRQPATTGNVSAKKQDVPNTIYKSKLKRYNPSTTQQKDSGGNQDDLSRTSSVSNINVSSSKSTPQSGALSKVRKTVSKDRLDNNEPASNKRAGTGSNNNQNADEDLRQRFEALCSEKESLAVQMCEQRVQLQKEINRLKMYQEQATKQLEQLSSENSLLRSKLRDVVHSPLSDNEKQMLLADSHGHHNSAPASIATNMLSDVGGGDVTACSTPDWDKQSSSNVSEVSVACLQDKINQMQESHYSTNEELQATLQELTDLQKQLIELQQDNDRLNDEKNLMFDSLCRQTDRLKDARDEIESLKQFLYRDKDDTSIEREQKLVDLLKNAQDEREILLIKQEQLSKELMELRAIKKQSEQDNGVLSERLCTLESTLDAKHAEHKQLDQEMARAKDKASSRQIEIDRLSDLLENARTKINELEQDRALGDKSELDELLDAARKEKDALEGEVAYLKEQVARGRNDCEKLREQVSILQEECKVLRNNAKCTQSELEYKVEKLTAEKVSLAEQLQRLEEAANELQVQAQCQMEDKRQLSAVLSETQRNMSEVERLNVDLEAEIADLKRLRNEENEEWQKFQSDLLTSVRVANDFKTEAQQELQKLIMENKSHRDKIRQLEAQNDKLKAGGDVALRPTSLPNDDEYHNRRHHKMSLNRQTSRQSVKSLIESIENAGKPISINTTTRAGSCCSRSNSTSSLNSLHSDGTPSSPSSLMPPPPPPKSPGSPLKTTTDWFSDSQVKTPLKEQTPNKTTNWNKVIMEKSDMVKSTGKDESLRDSLLQTAKGIDYSRRNSYSDACDRKDPLNGLVKNGGSKRNALLKWCQNKTVGYRNIDVTNFSSSWNDGLGFCALLHTYLPDRIPYDTLKANEKRRNFTLAFQAAESVGIPSSLNINDMVQQERPDWQQIMGYVTAIYKHFET